MAFDIVFILVGLCLIILHRKLAKGYADYQNRQFGFHFGEGVVRFNRILNIVGGIIFVVVGVLALMDVIPDFAW